MKMIYPKSLLPIILGLCFLLACNLGSFATPTPTRVAPSSTPTNVALKTAAPTRVAQTAPPSWWDKQIALPSGAESIGDSKRAMWIVRDTNTDGIRDFLVQQAKTAGYQTFALTQSKGAIYDLLLVKAQNAYSLNLTLGSDATIITAIRTGVMRLKVAGVTNIEIDLPLRTRIDTTPGSELSIGTAVPSADCVTCEYFINVHIAPFRGIGNYDSKPGISIVDVELVPGGNYDRDNFRWAIGGCIVNVRETGGDFDCRQLQNINDQSRRVDVSGNWTQP